ncbi:hypothetical protein [Thermaurantiacus tibetensis]|uniref:hypothetical protein n=1 Tax=Thermaurantiacus tibetensis TaxID=2759035 RepID=UPI00188F3030|nr:hypothetical protein [Thermaurantiacus tibetensis]
MLEPIVFAALLATVVVLAFARGGPEERIGAGALLAASLLTPVAQLRRFAGPEYGIVLVDALLFLVLAALGLRSRAFWPLWAAGFQLGALAVHLAAAKMPGMLPAAYAATLIIWSYPVVVAVGLGTWLEGRRGPSRRERRAGTGQ